VMSTDPWEELVLIEREQLKWLRAMAMPQVRATVLEALKNGPERLAFDMSDGSKAGRDISAALGVSPATVSAWWKKWRVLGIANDVEGRRVSHIASLAELGLDQVVGRAGARDA
jgi:hypothetical protein